MQDSIQFVIEELMQGNIRQGNLVEYHYSDIWKHIKNHINKDDFYNEAEKLITSELTNGKKFNNPFLLHMGGVPGSGKSYEIEKMKKTNKLNGVVLIQFDKIMMNLTPYTDALKEINKNDKKALDSLFAIWEMPARVVAWELVGRAIKQNYSLLIDSAGHSIEQYNLLTNIKKHGYKTGMFYIDISNELANFRAKIRMEKEGRSAPKGMIETRQELLKTLRPKYQKILDVFYFYLAQQNEENPVDPVLDKVFINGEEKNTQQTFISHFVKSK